VGLLAYATPSLAQQKKINKTSLQSRCHTRVLGGFMSFEFRHSDRLEGTEYAANAIARVSYTHDGILDFMLANPGVSKNAIAAHFGYTQSWLSQVTNSDAFLERMAKRKSDLIDPSLVASIDERLRAVAMRSLENVLEKLHAPNVDHEFSLEASRMSTKALGYGARADNLKIQQNFVVAMPQPVLSAKDWVDEVAPPEVKNAAKAAAEALDGGL
jgi:hypothetical protein